jgi:hypothetical protein
MRFLILVVVLAFIAVLSCNKPFVDETKQLEVNNHALEIVGNIDSFTIHSNVDWQITSTASWFSLSKTSGNGDSKIYVTTTQINTTGNSIAERITVTPVGTREALPQIVTIRQSYEKLSTKWTKVYGGSAMDTVYYMTNMADGGFVLVGNSKSDNGDLTPGYGDYDAWVIKVDGQGNKQWSKRFGGAGFDEALSVAQTTDGGCIMAGVTTSSNGDATGNHGGSDYLVIKLDATGNKQWGKVFGGSGDERTRSVIATSDGGYIVAGESGSIDGDLTNLIKGAWLVKLDGNGNKQWSKTYGGSGGEEIWSIINTSDGGYAVAGGINVNGDKDAWIIKTDGSGNQQWSKTFGGSRLDMAWSLVSTLDGGYVFSGGSFSSSGDLTSNYGLTDAWVVKLNGNGVKLWSKIFGGSSVDLGDNIIATSDGGFLLASSTWSTDRDAVANANIGSADALVIKLSADGNKQWSKMYGSIFDDCVERIVTTSDGFVIAGFTTNKDGVMQGNHGETDGFLIREKVQ